MRIIIALLVVAAVFAGELGSATAQGANESAGASDFGPAFDPASIQVSLTQVNVRRSVRRGLRGRIEVTLTNHGDTAVTMADLEIHALVWRDVDSGESLVLIHPCQCMGQLDGGLRILKVALAPGASEIIEFEDFGCSGSAWTPPPPGTYELTYRTHALDTLPPIARDHGDTPPEQLDWDPAETTAACRTMFTSDEFWAGAAVSAPVTVTLRGRP